MGRATAPHPAETSAHKRLFEEIALTSTPKRLAEHIFHSPRLDRVNLPAAFRTRSLAESCAMVRAMEMRGR
jgi:hypothetical protein